MAISGGIDIVAIQQALQQYVVLATGLPSDHVYWGRQVKQPRPTQPAIEMKLHVFDDVAIPWVDVTPKPLVVGPFTVAGVAVSPTSQLNVPAHGLSSGDGPFQFSSSGTLPAPLAASTNYWVIAADADHLQVCAKFTDTGGGDPGNTKTPIALTSTGSGVITMSATADTVHAGHEIQYLARGPVKLCLALTCFAVSGVGTGSAEFLLRRIGARRALPSQNAILQAANLGLNSIERVHAVHGVQDAVRFEPRATVEIYFNTGSEESEDGTIIESADVTDQVTGQVSHISGD